jgi:cytoplasmic iron level regulating protein YaaA (DUF328/UPF0246 family)
MSARTPAAEPRSTLSAVIVLLPPSESKSLPRRGAALRLDRLSFPSLTPAREQALRALAQVSLGPDAPTALGVSCGLADEIARNTQLLTAPTSPAESVYTGVLYAALDLCSLDTASHRRATRRLVIVSALFGALRILDRIPAYRLAMGVSLPPLGSLARHWRPPLRDVLPELAGSGLVVDTRSAPYAAAWTPQGQLAERWVHVRVPGASHFAKHTRGLVARTLCELPEPPRTPAGLREQLAAAYRVVLTEPERPGRPWLLDVTAR